MVHTNDKDWSIIFRRSRDDSFLGTSSNVKASLFFVNEDTSGLGDIVSASLAPLDLGGISLVEDVNLLSVNFDATIYLLDFTGVAAWYNY